MCLCYVLLLSYSFFFFFFNDTATTEIYTLSLHDALPILTFSPGGLMAIAHVSVTVWAISLALGKNTGGVLWVFTLFVLAGARSEEHTSELQSRSDLVCRLLLEKKKKSAVSSH